MTGPVGLLIWELMAGFDPAALWSLFADIWRGGRSGTGIGAGAMMRNSMILALGVAVVKCTISLLAAYALVFFRLPRSGLIYGVILVPMFFPIETRILPTFAVTSDLGLLNSYAGMILPITASGLGVLVFHQFLRQVPGELIEAAQLDGAGPLRVLFDIILPLSLPMMMALFAILFVLGWNQYVWPIMITTTSQDHDTLVRGMAYAGFGGQAGMALALLSLLPPALVVIVLQRWLMRGLTTGIH
ncbi:ABC transporter permease subunit [Ruegeria sp. 2012CJ41-6]|uniref:sn-glycerol-3-phosphate transport system permease protein UgpE n=1 Tax=Ruegeria spongiae TaxID=2942209 RepID=A0ABT0Q5Y5_9RHOB|nr:ABC transporter permease subunit [Ruegeria spongiae]MCL6284593.1 ABC transporter permease subunit [Ruegeria spongiae]